MMAKTAPGLVFGAMFMALTIAPATAQLIELNDTSNQTPDVAEQEAAQAPTQLPTQPQQGIEAPQALRPEALPAQPVEVSVGMRPQMVREARPLMSIPSTTQTVPQSLSSVSASTGLGVPQAQVSTGIGGSNPGNANTGGVQIQHVTVEPTQIANQEAGNSRSDLWRRERLRQELENETRMLERVEQGRLQDETRRAQAIESFKATVGSDGAMAPATTGSNNMQGSLLDATPVTALAANSNVPAQMMAPTSGAAFASEASISTSIVDSRFIVSPFVGYRWTDEKFNEFDVDNIVTAGISVGGLLNSYIGLEGVFAYAYDKFETRTFAVPTPYGPAYGPAPVPVPGYGYNPYYNGYNPYSANAYRARDSFELTGGVKVGYFRGRVNPFATARAGGILQKYRIDNAYTTQQAANIGWSRSTTHGLAEFGGGVDFRIDRSVNLGARFDYQTILASQNTAMNQLYGDARDRYRAVAELAIKF